MRHRDTNVSKKLKMGPGGLRCPCCNPYECSPRKMKARSSRRVRRVNKMVLKKTAEVE